MVKLTEILEALIFVHRGVLPLETIEKVLKDDYSREDIREGLRSLKEMYEGRGGSLLFLEEAGGYHFGTRPDLAEWIARMDFHEHHRHLSRPALETLAIVAYRQPVTRPEIEAVRGVNAERILRSLLEKKLIRIMGRKDVPGKPIVYGTTPDFLLLFGLNSLSDLPSLADFAPGEEIEVPPAGGEAEILPLEEGDEEAAGAAGEGKGETSDDGAPGDSPPEETPPAGG